MDAITFESVVGLICESKMGCLGSSPGGFYTETRQPILEILSRGIVVGPFTWNIS